MHRRSVTRGRVGSRPSLHLALATAAAAALLAGCVSPPSASQPKPPPTTDVWMAGDSLADATAARMVPRPWSSAEGGAGFTELSLRLIQNDTMTAIAQHGAPRRLLVMGGVNDTNRGLPTATVTDGMAAFEAAMVAAGVAEVIWLAEPAWQRAAEMAPINDWVLARPGSIDCRQAAGDHALGDPIHPADYGPFAACVDAALAGR